MCYRKLQYDHPCEKFAAHPEQWLANRNFSVFVAFCFELIMKVDLEFTKLLRKLQWDRFSKRLVWSLRQVSIPDRSPKILSLAKLAAVTLFLREIIMCSPESLSGQWILTLTSVLSFAHLELTVNAPQLVYSQMLPGEGAVESSQCTALTWRQLLSKIIADFSLKKIPDVRCVLPWSSYQTWHLLTLSLKLAQNNISLIEVS